MNRVWTLLSFAWVFAVLALFLAQFGKFVGPVLAVFGLG